MPELTMVEAITLALREELTRDPSVVLIGEDIGRKGGVFGATRGLQHEFGALRVMDAAIAEVGIAGMAIGAACAYLLWASNERPEMVRRALGEPVVKHGFRGTSLLEELRLVARG